MEQWLEVTIRTASGGIDLLCVELTEAGFDSFVIDDSEQFRQFLDGARAYWDYVDEKLAARMRDLSQVRLYLPEETAEAQLAELRALLAELPGRYPACEFGPLTLALDRIPGEDWANSWKQNYRPLPVGERLLVVPQWMTVDDLQGRLPVILDLGLTFGTGEHASTQLCMRALESLLHGGERVADLGSGSGILSVSALRLGAASAVGVDIDPLAVKTAVANAEVNGVAEISRSRNTKINQVRDTLGLVADYTFEDILGNSRPMQDVKKLAMSFAISPYNVLIYGESGTGKELFAQSIHNYSTRRNKPFVAINCASISPELIDSELFGYESGAFTGASKNGHVGKIELSNEGTLFLDEVAELPLHAQTRLLRTLETGQITRLGGSRNISVDVRVIAATNRSLEKMIEEGLFREDLYYRLMVLNITIPPLRERPEDIIPCCEFFLRQAMRTNTAGKKTIEKNAMKLLLGYDWPGNVRELRNIINRVYVMSSSSVISRESLIAAFQFNNPHYSGLTAEMTPAEMLREKQLEISRSYASLLKEALLLASGNKAEAAKLMGVSRKTIYNMLEKYKEYLK